MKILFVDNYDSFVYNLVQYFGKLNNTVLVVRNDRVTSEYVKKIKPSAIVISPGPGRPEDAGRSVEIIREFHKKIPILGVCLGHQAIAFAFGENIVRAKKIFHGKVSRIYHKGYGIFEGVKNPFEAVRYHSLVVKAPVKNSAIQVVARTGDGEIMGIKLKDFPVWGVQFHPESVLTEDGMKIISNFCKIRKSRKDY